MAVIITLEVKSYHQYYINNFVSCIKKRLNSPKYLKEQQVFLPKQISKFTVLCSPHVDKKSREQFEQRTHKRLIQWVFPTLDAKNKFMLYYFTRILSSFAVGVQLKLKYSLTSFSEV